MRYVLISLMAGALCVGSTSAANAGFLDDLFGGFGGIFKSDPVKAAKFNKCHKVLGKVKVCYSDTDTGAYWKFD